jgi:hypothetical protein
MGYHFPFFFAPSHPYNTRGSFPVGPSEEGARIPNFVLLSKNEFVKKCNLFGDTGTANLKFIT